MKSVLTIAGSDPGGGAGIQADLRVIESLGLAGLSAITAITVQNSQGVKSVHPVDADILAAQIEAVMEDATDLGAVKIGMLGGAAQVRVVAEMIRRFRPPNVVLDPVLASSGGVPLLDEAGCAALLSELIPLCDLITPNTTEAAVLTELTKVQTIEGIQEAASRLMRSGAPAVLIKGGHMPDHRSRDYLFENGQVEPRVITRAEIPIEDLHGTGCYLASGIASWLAIGSPSIWAAVHDTKGDLLRAMIVPVKVGKGRGYPDAYSPARFGDISTHAKLLAKLNGLYVLTDPDLRPDRTTEDIARAAVSGGARIVQLRDKHLNTPALIDLATSVFGIVKREGRGALYIVNDRVDVALLTDADGVHLGPEDMSAWQARRLLGNNKLIGVSVSTVEEARERALHASYLAVGAIFGSTTKLDAGDAVGVERIREIKAAFPNKPIVAIGGINISNIDSVIAAGADAAAVISAVVCAPDMQAAAAKLAGRFPA